VPDFWIFRNTSLFQSSFDQPFNLLLELIIIVVVLAVLIYAGKNG
jgi:hypothetical protein